NPQTVSATRSVHFDSHKSQHDVQPKTKNLFLQSHPEAQRCKSGNHAMHRSGGGQLFHNGEPLAAAR
ncbi:hypothetical protein, partial [Rubripirellula tenax]|uniref:hypothetical protein n=1 Tax=Rubripirellula tenax TaxID=2528015 RepID=UPI001C94B9C0